METMTVTELRAMRVFRVVRLFRDRPGTKVTIRKHLTLEEAQRWCHDPETSSATCTSAVGRRRTEQFGPWFDSYTYMAGIRHQ